ncbi:MAG: hypothetical protein K2Q25_02375 [Mycobacteriaceae bacterium]|nr:hypothetical protein [Mycobacteriaceae bacterium]
MSNPLTPKKLQTSGAKLWRAVAAKYTLRPDELRVLEDACREADLIDQIQAGLAGEPLYMTGSMGQKVANPLFAEVRQHRATFASLMRQLALPDEESSAGGGSPRSSAARKAANARWSKPRGANTGN